MTSSETRPSHKPKISLRRVAGMHQKTIDNAKRKSTPNTKKATKKHCPWFSLKFRLRVVSQHIMIHNSMEPHEGEPLPPLTPHIIPKYSCCARCQSVQMTPTTSSYFHLQTSSRAPSPFVRAQIPRAEQRLCATLSASGYPDPLLPPTAHRSPLPRNPRVRVAGTDGWGVVLPQNAHLHQHWQATSTGQWERQHCSVRVGPCLFQHN